LERSPQGWRNDGWDSERIACGSGQPGGCQLCFAELVRVLSRVGFDERIRGGHHIFTRDGMDEIINLQPKGGMAKPYQVKQVREIVTRHQFGVDGDD
jgi:predicted RNA binding protein YcfA (HicA-like mRNA interferase family)